MQLNWGKLAYSIKTTLLFPILSFIAIVVIYFLCPILAYKGYAPEVVFIILSLFFIPAYYVLGVYFSSFTSQFFIKLHNFQKILLVIYFLGVEPCFSVFDYTPSLSLFTIFIQILSASPFLYILVSHFNDSTLKPHKTLNILFFFYFTMLHLIMSYSYFSEHQWILFDDMTVNKKQIQGITYVSKNDDDLTVLETVHTLLPQDYQKLSCRVVVDSQLLFWKPEWLGAMLPSDGQQPIIVINKKLFTVKDDSVKMNLILRVLAHELTHGYQSIKYKFQHYLHPAWKTEGHATLIERQYHKGAQYIPYHLLEEEASFSFNFFFRREDYDAAFAQSWYYLNYLGFSEEEFYSDSTKLAPWNDIVVAWHEKHPDEKRRFLAYQKVKAQYSK